MDNSARLLIGGLISAASLAIVGLLGWMTSSLIDLGANFKVLSNTVSISMSNRYSSTDAERDFKIVNVQIASLAARLSELEHDVRSTKLEVQPLVSSPAIQDLSKRKR